MSDIRQPVKIEGCMLGSYQINLWYGNKPSEIDNLDISWSDNRLAYVGNLYIKGKPVGDFTTENTKQVEEWFSQFDWDKFWENY